MQQLLSSALACTVPPDGGNAWSLRRLARATGLSKDAVHRILNEGGQVEGRCVDRHTHQEFLAFLKYLYRKYPGKQLHVIIDNFKCPQTPKGQRTGGETAAVDPALYPTYASWLAQSGENLV